MLRRNTFASCLTFGLTLGLILAGTMTTAHAQTLTDPTLKLTTYLTGFSQPTQIRFLGADDLFITEKATGRVIRSQNGVKTTVLDLNVTNNSERGLLGVTLDKNFAVNKQVYVYYSVSNAGADSGNGATWTENRLSRFTFDGTNLTGETVLHTFGTAADGQTNGPNHDGGPIITGADGNLYGVNGDMNRNGAEQNNTNSANGSAKVGGLYRLDTDGNAPADNPFITNANADFHQWYSYGVRNSFGLAFDPVTGNLWDTENGPNVYDEINLVSKGMNSGWTKLMGPVSRDAQGTSDLVNLPGSTYIDPKFSFLNPIGITGINFLAGTTLGGAYQDAVIVGDNNTQGLYLLRLNAARNGFVLSGDLADGVADSATERDLLRFGSSFGVVTDIQVGADKAIYVSSLSTGNIYRISGAAAPEPGTLALLGLVLMPFVVGRACRQK